MATSSHHVLLIGGSGKIAKLLTPLLLQRSWTVTSIIRNPDQVADLQKLGGSSSSSSASSGKLNVLVRSVEDVKSVGDATSILDEVGADYVVWSAGAGGKGPAERVSIFFSFVLSASFHPFLSFVVPFILLSSGVHRITSPMLIPSHPNPRPSR